MIWVTIKVKKKRIILMIQLNVTIKEVENKKLMWIFN